jgi:hypothetical protein
MSSYTYIKKFRKKIKSAIVQSFGGKCCKCGFDKFEEGFDVHHLDPSKKDFALSRWKSLNISKLKTEASKCILVCSNCHRGIHAGYIDIDGTEQRLNQELFDKLTARETAKQSPCEVCGTMKTARQRFCSHKCANHASRKVDWDSIDLKKELETKSINKIAIELNISFNAVKKRMKRLNINE